MFTLFIYDKDFSGSYPEVYIVFLRYVLLQPLPDASSGRVIELYPTLVESSIKTATSVLAVLYGRWELVKTDSRVFLKRPATTVGILGG